MEKPTNKWMIWGVFPPLIFGSTPIYSYYGYKNPLGIGNNGSKPYEQMDDLGGFPTPYIWFNTPIFGPRYRGHQFVSCYIATPDFQQDFGIRIRHLRQSLDFGLGSWDWKNQGFSPSEPRVDCKLLGPWGWENSNL